MITKERLEELIEQGAKIYGIGKQNNVFEFRLKLKKNAMYLRNQENFKKSDWYKKKLETYSTFFETKEEAEWELEFGNITRPETLNLPSWEEFSTKNYRCCFFGKNNKIITLDCFNGKTMEINENEITIFEKPLTKENYIEACRIAKKLFLGEEI